MTRYWRISTLNGVLLATYFIPMWTIAAARIIVWPVRGLYDPANIAAAIYIGDHLQLSPPAVARFAWLLALAKITVALFFAMFAATVLREDDRYARSGEEPLTIALMAGVAISFVSMIFAVLTHEQAALRIHATESLMLLGAAIVFLVDGAKTRDTVSSHGIPPYGLTAR
jgi:hypothetical protein